MAAVGIRAASGDRPTRRWRLASGWALAVGVLAGGCSALGLDPTACHTSGVVASAASLNADNVLSAILAVRVTDADSVSAQFGPVGAALDSVTPAVPVAGDSVEVPVLGLLPETGYQIQAVLHRPCGDEEAPVHLVTTGSLPDDLPVYSAGGSDPSPGYVAFAAGSYGLVIDNAGRVVWYHRFPGGPGLNFETQPDGHWVADPPPSAPSAGLWVEIDPLGRTTRTFGCGRGLRARFHDLLLEPDGSYWVMCDETKTIDLSSLGGVADARVTGTVVQRIDAGGAVLFEWSPFDHFAITDLDPAARTGETVNWTHGNSLDRDSDTSLVVSFRSLSEITKIDSRTGAVLWRMGGLRNQFGFENVADPPYTWQHGVRRSGAAELVLLDNRGEASSSRVERYRYDEARRTVRLEQAYVPGAQTVALLGGTVQELPGGHILAAYGNGGRVEEYDVHGNVVWEIYGNPGYVFRAQRILSLYRPGVGLPR